VSVFDRIAPVTFAHGHLGLRPSLRGSDAFASDCSSQPDCFQVKMPQSKPERDEQQSLIINNVPDFAVLDVVFIKLDLVETFLDTAINREFAAD